MIRGPTTAAIRAAEPLTHAAERGTDPIMGCNICGKTAAPLCLYVECDALDMPIEGPNALLYVGEEHPDCILVVQRHPRLYKRANGRPGTFPRLCGPCVHRRGVDCTHPDLIKNGGTGLVVSREPGPRGIVCGKDGCRIMAALRPWVRCKGRRTLRLVHGGTDEVV